MDEPPSTSDDGSEFSLRAIGRSTALVTGAAALAQLLTIGRELVVASQIGLSPRLDALVVALVIPTVISGLLTSGTTTALVPAYMETARTLGGPAARRLVGATGTWVGLAALVLTAMMLAVPGLTISLTGPGLDAPARLDAISLLPVVAPIAVLGVSTAFLTTLCQSEGRFGAIATATVAAAATSFLVTVGLWASLDIVALALATSLAGLASSVVLAIFAARAGVLPRPTLRADREPVVRMFRHALPLTASAAILSVNTIADRAIASLFRSGSLSALRYGDQLVRLPVSAIGPAWGTVTYPSLVRTASPTARSSLGASSQLAIRYVLALFVPLAVATIALAPLVVDVVYRRGAFDAEAVERTAVVVTAFAPLIAFTMVQPILVGAHNARRHGRILLVTGIANAVLNLSLDIVFGTWIGVAGIALSSSVTVGLLLAFLGWRLAVSEPDFGLAVVGKVAAKATFASVIAAVPVGLIAWTVRSGGSFGADLVLLVGLTAAGGAAYLVLARLIRLDEPGVVVNGIGERARRRLSRSTGE